MGRCTLLGTIITYALRIELSTAQGTIAVFFLTALPSRLSSKLNSLQDFTYEDDLVDLPGLSRDDEVKAEHLDARRWWRRELRLILSSNKVSAEFLVPFLALFCAEHSILHRFARLLRTAPLHRLSLFGVQNKQLVFWCSAESFQITTILIPVVILSSFRLSFCQPQTSNTEAVRAQEARYRREGLDLRHYAEGGLIVMAPQAKHARSLACRW